MATPQPSSIALSRIAESQLDLHPPTIDRHHLLSADLRHLLADPQQPGFGFPLCMLPALLAAAALALAGHVTPSARLVRMQDQARLDRLVAHHLAHAQIARLAHLGQRVQCATWHPLVDPVGDLDRLDQGAMPQARDPPRPGRRHSAARRRASRSSPRLGESAVCHSAGWRGVSCNVRIGRRCAAASVMKVRSLRATGTHHSAGTAPSASARAWWTYKCLTST